MKSYSVIKIWAWKQKVYKLVFRYTSDLLKGIHALGEDVVPHDAHNDGHLGNGNVSFKAHTQTIHS